MEQPVRHRRSQRHPENLPEQEKPEVSPAPAAIPPAPGTGTREPSPSRVSRRSRPAASAFPDARPSDTSGANGAAPDMPQVVIRHAAQRQDVQASFLPDDAPSRREALPFPRPLALALCALLVLALALAYASHTMQAYLDKQARDRVQAHEAMLSAYPYSRYEPLIRRYADLYNLHSAYVAGIILNESHFDPRAVSSVGARGLMQLMPDTASWIADKLSDRDYTFDRMFDPETNIRYGCWYLNYLCGLFGGDPASVTSAYHAGQGTVRNWLSDGTSSQDGGRTLSLLTMPEGPTRTYARRVTSAYAIYDALYDHVHNPEPVSADDTPEQ